MEKMYSLICGYEEFLINSCSITCLSIILMICFEKLIQLFRRQQNNNYWTSNDLHRAVFENDTVKSIQISSRKPQFINQIHPADGYTPFMRACLTGNTMLVKYMLTCGAQISLKSAKGETPLFLSSFYHIKNPQINDASCIRTLFYAGADINEPNANGHTPLDLAATFGHANLCMWLLEKGANVENSIKPYFLARYNGQHESAKVLKNQLQSSNKIKFYN